MLSLDLQLLALLLLCWQGVQAAAAGTAPGYVVGCEPHHHQLALPLPLPLLTVFVLMVRTAAML
jgi:hypothetical protein